MNSTVPGSDLESIPRLGNSFTRSEQCLVGDPHDARIVAQVQEIRRFVFAESRVENTLFVFVSVLAHISILVPAVVSPDCADRSCHDISWLYCRSYRDISTSVRLSNPAVSKSRKDNIEFDPQVR